MFGLREAQGDGPPKKIRLIDNYKISGANSAHDLLEISHPYSFNVVLTTDRAHFRGN